MTEPTETTESAAPPVEGSAKADAASAAERARTTRWVAAAGIGSAALVAALLYANRGRNGKKP